MASTSRAIIQDLSEDNPNLLDHLTTVTAYHQRQIDQPSVTWHSLSGIESSREIYYTNPGHPPPSSTAKSQPPTLVSPTLPETRLPSLHLNQALSMRQLPALEELPKATRT